MNIPQSLEYDANLKTLTTKFYRKLVGSSENDYTFKLNQPYEYKIIWQVWDNFNQNDGGRGRESTERDSSNNNEKFTITFLPASYDRAKYITVAALAGAASLGAILM